MLAPCMGPFFAPVLCHRAFLADEASISDKWHIFDWRKRPMAAMLGVT
jgi:hypothetical protein